MSGTPTWVLPALATALSLVAGACAQERGPERYQRTDPEWPLVLRVHQAAQVGDLGVLKRAIRGGMHPDIRGQQEETPLMVAARRGHLELVSYLIGVGAKVNSRNLLKHSALMYAAEAADVDIVRRLIEAGADLDATDERGWTALHRAADAGSMDVVVALLEAGADLEAGENPATPLELAERNQHVRVAELIENFAAGEGLTTRQLRPTDRRRDRELALVEAARKGDWFRVEELLEAGVDPDAVDDDGRTALMLASSNGHVRTVKLLLGAYAGLDERKNGTGATALSAAAAAGELEIVELLLDAGADPEIASPLLSAMSYNRREIALALIDAGATIDPEAAPAVLDPPVRRCDEELVAALLAAGADASRARMSAEKARSSAACRRVAEMLALASEEQIEEPFELPF